MKRLSVFKKGDKEKIANILCNIIQDTCTSIDDDFCDRCPATKWCSFGHNGFIDWLEQEEQGHERK